MTETIILPIHVLVLLATMWTIFQADHLGFTWIRGREAVLDSDEVHKLHLRTWIGLVLMIATGLILFWPERGYLLTRPQFYVKMAFVLALFVNSFVIGHLQSVAAKRRFDSLSFSERIPLFISGAVSTISWLGAAVTAFFLMPD